MAETCTTTWFMHYLRPYQASVATFRYNFRSVQNSGGSHGEGKLEILDCQAAFSRGGLGSVCTCVFCRLLLRSRCLIKRRHFGSCWLGWDSVASCTASTRRHEGEFKRASRSASSAGEANIVPSKKPKRLLATGLPQRCSSLTQGTTSYSGKLNRSLN